MDSRLRGNDDGESGNDDGESGNDDGESGNDSQGLRINMLMRKPCAPYARHQTLRLQQILHAFGGARAVFWRGRLYRQGIIAAACDLLAMLNSVVGTIRVLLGLNSLIAVIRPKDRQMRADGQPQRLPATHTGPLPLGIGSNQELLTS